MARFRPTELQEYLRTLGALPKRGLSQNFLIDGNILNKIVALAQIEADDLIVEIGPGPGALTEKLLEKGGFVIAIEKDQTMGLALIASNHPKLQLFVADVLDFPLEELLKKHNRKAKIVANLPYNLTTPIIQKIVKLQDVVTSCTLMVQEEVARRVVAPQTSKDVVAFTILLHYYTKPIFGFKVLPTCFYPVPKVHSAVIRLDLERKMKVSDEEHFFALVNAAFSQRRKMLKASLKTFYQSAVIEQALHSIGKQATCRPEELSVEEWVHLYQLFVFS